MAVEDARDDERGPQDRSASLTPYTPRERRLLRRSGGPDVRRGDDEESGEPAEGRGGRMRAFFGHVTDRVIATAPRVPVRNLETLHAQFPGLGPEEIADRLISGACKGSATVGAGVGAAAMLPTPPAMPAELAAEIAGVASVELKLIAELHEVYGRRPPGSATERASAYLSSWTSERGIDLAKPVTLNTALGGQLRRELRQQIMKRTLRNLPNLTPFMIGAAVGAVMNRRDTRRLAEHVRADLRARGPVELPGPRGELEPSEERHRRD